KAEVAEKDAGQVVEEIEPVAIEETPVVEPAAPVVVRQPRREGQEGGPSLIGRREARVVEPPRVVEATPPPRTDKPGARPARPGKAGGRDEDASSGRFSRGELHLSDANSARRGARKKPLRR